MGVCGGNLIYKMAKCIDLATSWKKAQVTEQKENL